jgi:hypothetical protein
MSGTKLPPTVPPFEMIRRTTFTRLVAQRPYMAIPRLCRSPAMVIPRFQVARLLSLLVGPFPQLIVESIADARAVVLPSTHWSLAALFMKPPILTKRCSAGP